MFKQKNDQKTATKYKLTAAVKGVWILLLSNVSHCIERHVSQRGSDSRFQSYVLNPGGVSTFLFILGSQSVPLIPVVNS